MDEAPGQDLPVQANLRGPPGGPPSDYVAPPDGVSVAQLATIAHEYIHGSKSVDAIAVQTGLSTRDVRGAIRRYGYDKRKAEIISQIQQEELAAYSKFLLDNRVTAAEQHLRISTDLNKAVAKIIEEAGKLSTEELESRIKPLKAVAGMYKTLAEALSASSTVGARAVSLGTLADQTGALALAGSSGKKPLVSLSFNVVAPGQQAAPRPAEAMDAEFTQEPT